MILTCENCSKRYLVDPRALGGNGRRVRCASCSHTWFQVPPEETDQLELPPLPEQAPTIVRMTSDTPRRVQLPAVTPSGARSRYIRWGVIALVVLLVLWGLIGGRGAIMRTLPFTTKIYSMVGLGPTLPGYGLELRKVTPSRSVENGAPALAIDGEVANISSATREVPQLRVALRDANDHELQVWTITVTEQRLLAGATVSFHTSIQQPPDGATGVIVSFVGAGG
jgi:predicted Zn finger-like uncharacterized protein